MADIECENCGGNDFYKEAGYYYCKECQVQSPDIQELVFQSNVIGEDGGGPSKLAKSGSRKLHTDPKRNIDNKEITSWECYNNIMHTLCTEMIELGAQPRLKSVVKLLWLRYLHKLEVIKMEEHELPHLQAVNSSRDAAIIYGKRKKRKRNRSTGSSSEETNVSTLDSSIVKSMRTRKKRALIKSHYENLTQSHESAPSLNSETLTSLKSSEHSSKKSQKIKYNRYSRTELKRKQSKRHLKKHCVDFDHELNCHRATYKNVSHGYRTSPHLLSLNKLYAILNLGLLIIQDKIRLCDMLRFIEEGNLSFNSYSQTYPEDYSEKKVNFADNKKNCVFSSDSMRKLTKDLAKFLDVKKFIPEENLNDLCERFCEELNLPNEICVCAKKILTNCDLKMSFRKGRTTPNYEARVLGVIVFVLKLLFGLDGVTEYKMAEYTEILNGTTNDFFDIISWLKFIESRRTAYENIATTGDVFAGLATSKIYPDIIYNQCKDNYYQILGRLKQKLPLENDFTFVNTLTPLHVFTENYNFINNNCFADCTIAHILHPHVFISIANGDKNPKWIPGGCNSQWILEPLTGADSQKKERLKKQKEKVTVELAFEKNRVESAQSPRTENTSKLDEFRKIYFQVNKENFMKDKKFIYGLKGLKNIKSEEIRKRVHNASYENHYNPFETYWLRIMLQSESLNKQEWDVFFEKYPFNFKVLFKECCSILNQSEKEFFAELQLTELHLLYGGHLPGDRSNCLKSKSIHKFLSKTERLW